MVVALRDIFNSVDLITKNIKILNFINFFLKIDEFKEF